MENFNKKRQIAIFTDVHGLLEPTMAVLDDIRRRGITEIYSLGDNIGVGPNPKEVINLLEDNGVISVAGNSEEYITLGIEPFKSYFTELKYKSHLWTLSKLGEREKGIISLYPHSIELLVGGKNLALCHFANDVRFDFRENSTWSYQNNVGVSPDAYKQFLYTNSNAQSLYMSRVLLQYGFNNPLVKGFLSAMDDPLFAGNRVSFYDAIIQGHVHWKIYDRGGGTDFYSIRAVGMGYDKDPIDSASYVILTEQENGYDFQEVLVKYDRERMEYSILNSSMPDLTIRKFVEFGRSR